MAEIYMGEDAHQLKNLYCQTGIATYAEALEIRRTDLRFKNNKHEFLVVRSEDKNTFRVIHQDACAKHPSFDADECPLSHPENS